MEDICPFCKNKFGISYVGTNNCNDCKISVDNHDVSLIEDYEIYKISHIDNICKVTYNPYYYKSNDTIMYFDDSDIFDIFKYNSKNDYLNSLKKIMVLS
jgi:hypothetical protein